MVWGKSTKIITKSIPFCQAFALVLLARFFAREIWSGKGYSNQKMSLNRGEGKSFRQPG
jgi:hypothetical protein